MIVDGYRARHELPLPRRDRDLHDPQGRLGDGTLRYPRRQRRDHRHDKRGRKGEKPTVDFKASVGVSEPIRYPDYLGSADYATLYNEAMLNDNPSLDPGSASLFSQETISNFRRAKGDNSDGLGYNWDYFDYAFKPSILQDYSLSVRGGTDRAVISSSAATITRAATTSIRTPTTSTSSCAITSAPTSMSTPPSG